MPLFRCQVKNNVMLCDMSGMIFLKFEVKKGYQATNPAGYEPILTNGRALSFFFLN